jgi:hypothetical protein
MLLSISSTTKNTIKYFGTRMTLVGRIGTDVDGGRWNADDADGAD